MSSLLTTYEVKVKVKTGLKRYQSFLGMFVQDEIVKMFHQDAKSPRQAMQKCEKYGVPISVHKADITAMFGNPEKLSLLEEPYSSGNPYETAIAMDEMIWQKKENRANRLQNRKKDKKKS